MTNTKRWLDELPLESRERELLLVGKSARPAEGTLDANWQALCVALSTTAAGTAVGTSSVAANSVTAKVGSSLVVSKAAGAGLFLAGAKSLAIGVAVGLAVMGAGALAERSSGSGQRPSTLAKASQAPSARAPSTRRLPTPSDAPPDTLAVAPASARSGAAPGLSSREHLAASGPALNPSSTPAPASPQSSAERAASLSQQARELAELKRLIDGGATSEALRRLEASLRTDAAPMLAEERDALYVQALERAQRREEARAFARRFLIHYPHSPYFESMRQLLAEK